MGKLYFDMAEKNFYDDELDKAIVNYRKALEKGYFDAAYELGIIYSGELESCDLEKALYFFKLGAEKNSIKCKKEFSNMIVEKAKGEVFFYNLKDVLMYNEYDSEKLLRKIKEVLEFETNNNQYEYLLNSLEECYEYSSSKMKMQLPEYIIYLRRKFFQSKILQVFDIENLIIILKEINAYNCNERFDQVNKYNCLIEKTIEKIFSLYIQRFHMPFQKLDFEEFLNTILDSFEIKPSQNNVINFAWNHLVKGISDFFENVLNNSKSIEDVLSVIEEIDKYLIIYKLNRIKKMAVSRIENMYVNKIEKTISIEDCNSLWKNISNIDSIKDSFSLKLKYNEKIYELEKKTLFNLIDSNIKAMTDVNDYEGISNKINNLNSKIKEELQIKLDLKMMDSYVRGKRNAKIDFAIAKEFYKHDNSKFVNYIDKFFKEKINNDDYLSAYEILKFYPSRSEKYKDNKEILTELIKKDERYKNYAFNYEDEFANFVYCCKYSNYILYDKYYINYLFEKHLNLNKKNINLLFLGCGNFQEIDVSLDWFLKRKLDNKKINITIIDKQRWKYNFSENILDKQRKFKECNIEFIEANFFFEIPDNRIKYSNYDIVYLSRCINPIEQKQNGMNYMYFEYVMGIIDVFDNAIIAFSQIINYESLNPIRFENELYQFLKTNYKISIIKDRYLNNIDDEPNKIELYNSKGLNFYLYLVKKWKC